MPSNHRPTQQPGKTLPKCLQFRQEGPPGRGNISAFMPIQFLALFLGLPTSISISSSNCEGVFVFFFFCNSNTCPLETGRRPLNSCQMVTVMFIDPIHRSASMLHKVPKSYIARHLATGRVSISLALRLALKVLFVLARLILGKQELFLNCYLPHFCPQSCSSNFW